MKNLSLNNEGGEDEKEGVFIQRKRSDEKEIRKLNYYYLIRNY